MSSMCKWTDNSKKVMKLAQSGVENGIEVEGEKFKTKVKRRTPVETGALRDSIYADENIKKLTLNIGSNLDYALDVHENPKSKGFKFLERTLNESQQIILKDIAKEMKKELGL